MFYVYEWYVIETGEIFYVGKGTHNRYKVRKHNRFFNDFLNRYNCASRIVKQFENEKDAFDYEFERVNELRAKGQCVCNIYDGGTGGTVASWTDEKREKYSQNNVMKSHKQRERMRTNNPMKQKKAVNSVRKKLRRAVIINGVRYETAKDAAKAIGVVEITIRKWCGQGYNSQNEPCSYADGKPTKSQKITRVNYTKSAHSKPVILDGKYFESVTDAAQSVGARPSNFRLAMTKNGKYKGHICKYANQQPSRGNTDNSTPEGSTTNK